MLPDPEGDYHVVIAGGGPAGGQAVRDIAKQGYDVAVLETDEEVGDTRQSTGGTFTNMTAQFGIPPEEVAMSSTDSVVLESRNNDFQMDHPGYVLDFGEFKRYLANDAIENGAEYILDSHVTGIDENPGSDTVFVEYNGEDGSYEVEADIVMDATGHNMAIGRDLDMVDPDSQDLAIGIEYELEGVSMDNPGAMVMRIDQDYAPGGYSWIFDTGDNTAKVGVCGLNRYKERFDEEGLAWDQYLDRFIEEDPRLGEDVEKGENHRGAAHIFRPDSLVDDNVMLIGDTVSSIDPVFGEGINNCMISGRVAAMSSAEAIQSGDYSSNSLSTYEDRWNSRIGNDKAAREFLTHFLYSLDDRRVDRFIEDLNDMEMDTLENLDDASPRAIASTLELGDLKDISQVARENPDTTKRALRNII